MKNIHVIPTPNSSRLVKQKYDTIDRLCLADMATKRAEYKRFNIYITSEEEIKEGCYLDLTHNIIMKSVFYSSSDKNCQKIILTTDQDLIKDGVQAIDDAFLEWFVNNPSCEKIEVESNYRVKSGTIQEHNEGKAGYEYYDYKIIIPKEEPEQHVELINDNIDEFDKAIKLFKQETLYDAFLNCLINKEFKTKEDYIAFRGAEFGAKWQQERSYSEEEVINLLYIRSMCQEHYESDAEIREWFNKFKKK
jgi:hypothetical protein